MWEGVLSDGAVVKHLLMTFPQWLMDSDLKEGDEEWSGDKVCLCVRGCVI